MNYLELAEKAGVNLALATPSYKEFLILYGDLVAEREREECAKVCEDSVEYAGYTLASAIRARGQS